MTFPSLNLVLHSVFTFSMYSVCVFNSYIKCLFLQEWELYCQWVGGKASAGLMGHRLGGATRLSVSRRKPELSSIEVVLRVSEPDADFLPTVIDALFQRRTEGEGRVAKTVKGAGRVLTPAILTVRGVLALIHICKGHHRHWLQYEHLLGASSESVGGGHNNVEIQYKNPAVNYTVPQNIEAVVCDTFVFALHYLVSLLYVSSPASAESWAS